MRATTSLSVILVAAILALGDGAYLVEDNRDAQRGKTVTDFVIFYGVNASNQATDGIPINVHSPSVVHTANNEEMEDIQRALNQLKADAAAESCS